MLFRSVGRLRDDFEDMQRKLVVEALDGIPGVRVAIIDRELQRFVPGLTDANASTNDDTVKRSTREGRTWMADKNADLLLWGNIDSTGRNVELHFIATASSPGERPGRFTAQNMLVIPVDFYNDW